MIEFLIQQYNAFMHFYFWVYLIFFILTLIDSFSEDYQLARKNKIDKGLYSLSISASGLIMFTLWVMSWYF
jgi:hypothetical protein